MVRGGRHSQAVGAGELRNGSDAVTTSARSGLLWVAVGSARGNELADGSVKTAIRPREGRHQPFRALPTSHAKGS
jgi:hypothetical protein